MQRPPANRSGIALYAEPQASVVPLHYGIDNYSSDFDLTITVHQNVTTFDSNTNFVEAARAEYRASLDRVVELANAPAR